jgi:DNA-binding GntR family transcriptional regulator
MADDTLVPTHPGLAERRASTSARRPSLGEEIYESLLSQLISLKIAPGSRIAVDALVREMGVSQTPIRAALIRLEAEGLVVKTHNVGYSAAPMPTRRRFEEIYAMRMLIEPYTAAQAAARMSSAARQELAQMARSMGTPDENNTRVAYGKFALRDAQFHARIAAESGNELAADTLGRLYAHMHLFRLRFHSGVTDGAIKEHEVLINAFLAGDPEAARRAMLFHIESSRERMAPYFELLE